MIADLPNPLAKAREEFMLSREACYLCDPTSIGAPAHCGLYLHDRIEAAFLAGWNACEQEMAASVSALRDVGVTDAQPSGIELAHYDAGLLNDYGGGKVEWWQDYIRGELGRAHAFYQSQIPALSPKAAPSGDEE